MMAGDEFILFEPVGVTLRVVSKVGTDVSTLEENGRYEYEVLSEEYKLKEKIGIITSHPIAKKRDGGTIEPKSFVGLLKLVLLEKASGETVAETYIDVRSKKLEYETEYRTMLEDIANRCADFLLQLESPVDQAFTPDDDTNTATLAQRLYFLKSLVGGEDFQQALQRIVQMPNTRWREEVRTMDVRRSRRMGRYEVRQFASAGRRMRVPERHPLRDVMETVPERVEARDKRDTVDTPENRFVKHALNMFLQTLEDLLEKFHSDGTKQYPELRSEITGLINDLEEVIAHDVFKQVARPDVLPLNSPVLQRQAGYRQVLRAWLLLDLAAKLSWTGGDDVYAGGKRDAAALYEYWVFFKLLDLVADLFKLDRPAVESLLNNKELVLKLKAGRYVMLKGSYEGAGRTLRVKFSYNRSFFNVDRYPLRGSWTRDMRPDYTLSLWPEGIHEKQAEVQELITHVHFDAKYRVAPYTQCLTDEISADDEMLNSDLRGKYKRDDLLKMHAYRDAIRRTAGAYIIYPGGKEEHFKGFRELLPGLGAFR